MQANKDISFLNYEKLKEKYQELISFLKRIFRILQRITGVRIRTSQQ